MLFSKHALLKIEERKIDKDLIVKVIKDPNILFYDIISRCMVAIGRVKIAGTETHLVVPYVRENDHAKVVTVYPCRDIKKEITGKEGKRWVKVR
ncbi:MAG: DUF4258 domain-containing protein [Candidatus Anammoxibacter sp.]